MFNDAASHAVPFPHLSSFTSFFDLAAPHMPIPSPPAIQEGAKCDTAAGGSTPVLMAAIIIITHYASKVTAKQKISGRYQYHLANSAKASQPGPDTANSKTHNCTPKHGVYVPSFTDSPKRLSSCDHGQGRASRTSCKSKPSQQPAQSAERHQ